MYYIGIDLGTSAVKTLLIDCGGKILKVVSREYPLEIPYTGWSQQNPYDWEKAVFSAIPALIEGIDAQLEEGII